MRVTVRRVSISSEPETDYFLRLDWKGRDLASGFKVLLTDGQSAWDGEVSEAAVRSEAAELEMKVETYAHDLQQVLTGEGVGHGFTLTPGHAPGRTLTYERRQRDIWIRLGSVELTAHPAPLGEVRALLCHLLTDTQALEQRNQQLHQDNHTLRQEHQHATTELERYAVEKEALEAELFSRFVLVLNEKKAKIRSLQERITHLQDDSREDGASSGAGRRETAPARPAPGKEDEYGGSTDEERAEEEEEEEEEEEDAGPAPDSTQPDDTRGRASASDDSLSDSTDVAPCRKRRFRHLRPAPELAAAKRPPPEPARTHRRGSLAKSNKTTNQQPAPQRSSDAMTTGPDVEELFEDL